MKASLNIKYSEHHFFKNKESIMAELNVCIEHVPLILRVRRAYLNIDEIISMNFKHRMQFKRNSRHLNFVESLVHRESAVQKSLHLIHE